MTDQTIEILDQLPLGIVVADDKGNPLLVNRAGEPLLALCGGCVPALTDLISHEYRVDRNGRTIEITVSPVQNNVLFLLKDVTDSSPAEASENQREKYIDMGELAATIAQDIRNPLGSIELFASLLKKGIKKEKDLRRIDSIISSVKTVNSRISRLILLNQACESFADPVRIHDILKDIMLYSEQVIDRETIYLSIRTVDMDPVIEGNPDMIRQIFLSLLLAALQSLPLSGRLDIETIHIPAPPSVEVHFRAAGREFLQRVSGTETNAGMGLAIIHHIMTMHRGSVRIEQDSKENTAFILSFPLRAENVIAPVKMKP
jgi:signal transduction histidine kinase